MAAYNDYTVEVYDPGTTAWVEIPLVQSLRCTLGRQTTTEQWQTSTATIEARYPTGFDTPIGALRVDAWIRFTFPGRTVPAWTGTVRDVRTEINLPWDGVDTGEGDLLIIEAEGYSATWGRYQRRYTGYLSKQLGTLLQLIASGSGALYPGDDLLSGDDLTISDFNRIDYTTGIRNSFTWLVTAANTTLARICDGVAYDSATFSGFGVNDSPCLWVSNQSSVVISPITFSDTGNDATNSIYYELELDGLADTYFTQIALINEQIADYTLDVIPSNILRSYVVSAMATSTDQAEELARAYSAFFSRTTPGIGRITARTSGQHTQNLDTLGVANQELGYLVLNQVAVEIRGQTYYAQIEGVEVSATLGETVFTYYLSPVASIGWFILDDSDYGVLDQNRLAYT